MITFAHIWFLLLVPLAWVVRWVFPAHREAKPSLQVPFMMRLEEVSGRKVQTGSAVQQATRLQRAMVVVVWILLVVAIARPQWIGETLTKTVATRDLLLAVDLSTSMDQQDFQAPDGTNIDRLTAVKLVVDDFLTRRQGDRVGLILFGSAAFVQTPFTEDIEACRALLDEARIGMAGPKTMLGDAIGLSISVFEKSDLTDRVLILLTDGNDSGSKVPPENAARIAKDYGITIHTIVVGAEQTTGSDAIDADTLRLIAETTGGGFFQASSREELEAIYDDIDAMKPRDAEVLTHRPTSELYHWPMGCALVLILMFHAIRILLSVFSKNHQDDRIRAGASLRAPGTTP
jgi:Ca-activated chloride channel family protein